MAKRLKTPVLRGLTVACAAAMLSLSGAATAQDSTEPSAPAVADTADAKSAPKEAMAGGAIADARAGDPLRPSAQDDVGGGMTALAALLLSVLALLGTIGVLLMHLNFKKKVAVLLGGAQEASAGSRAPSPEPRPTANGRSRPLVSDSAPPPASRYKAPDPMPDAAPGGGLGSAADRTFYDRKNAPEPLPEDGVDDGLSGAFGSRIVGGDPAMFDRARAGEGYSPPIPVLTPVPSPGAQPQTAPPPVGPRLLLSLPALQSLIERGADMAASEFRGEADRLGQWFEADIGPNGAVLHTGEDDGHNRPIIAILQSDRSVAIVPSASFARDFPHQNYKIGNAAALEPFFDLQVGGTGGGAGELRLIQPALARMEGRDLVLTARGALAGFSD